MWLPKDERRLLFYWYLAIGRMDQEESFELRELVHCLICKDIKELIERRQKKKSKPTNIVQAVDEYIDERNRVEVAITALQQRGLIILKEYSGELQIKSVCLTLQGFDLGKKYSSWWTRSGLWFAEYKNHWIWLIGSFVSGIFATLFVLWLSKVLKLK
jgi:hypothetical protein